MKCKNCGREIPSGIPFCPNCGQRIIKGGNAIEIPSETQLTFPTVYEELNAHSLYLFNLENFNLYSSQNERLGTITIKNKILKIIAELYDTNEELILSVSPTFLSFKTTFKIEDSRHNEIAHVKKVVFSPMIKNFYIISPSNENWFSIIKSRRSNYKIKSFSTDRVVGEFGNITQLQDIILDFSYTKPNHIYFLQVYDDKINRLLLLGSFICIYLTHFFQE
ncbi:MAG: hypothetical protein BAJALOKI1v1_120028 [Promethearchaeota archaeon]|nr:MAG: hypothetical protein BAJALOKI1v1_120028 [Candidatus Lokiarchaeota archaeon]